MNEPLIARGSQKIHLSFSLFLKWKLEPMLVKSKLVAIAMQHVPTKSSLTCVFNEKVGKCLLVLVAA